MAVAIESVSPGSPAAKKKIHSGDKLLSINGHAISDVLDYRFYINEEKLVLEVEKDGKPKKIKIKKDETEDIGLEFKTYLMDRKHACKNKCVFCFIDQMPPNLRRTLYVKDDDWRLSLMMGNYITMTNITDAEFDRILRRKVSPLFISVHATDPQVRTRLLRNPRAGDLMPRLRRLKEGGIRFHCQVVLCPGWNDGDVLLRTLEDLIALRPAACSAAHQLSIVEIVIVVSSSTSRRTRTVSRLVKIVALFSVAQRRICNPSLSTSAAPTSRVLMI